MVRTQIQLTEQQSERLKSLAAKEGVSVAEIIRRCVDKVLEPKDTDDWEERRRRALSVVGAFSSGESDVSARHDDYLAEIYGQ